MVMLIRSRCFARKLPAPLRSYTEGLLACARFIPGKQSSNLSEIKMLVFCTGSKAQIALRRPLTLVILPLPQSSSRMTSLYNWQHASMRVQGRSCNCIIVAKKKTERERIDTSGMGCCVEARWHHVDFCTRTKVISQANGKGWKNTPIMITQSTTLKIVFARTP